MTFCSSNVFFIQYMLYWLVKSIGIEFPYIPATRTRFVQPGKIEIDANEKAVVEEFKAAFSFAPSSILSLTIYDDCRFEHM